MESARVELPTFWKETAVWAVAYRRKVIHLPASKGLAYLSRLVAEPGTRIPASDLASRDAGRGDARTTEQDRVNVTKGIKAAIKKIAVLHPSLGVHLESGVRTGAFCCYVPVLSIDADSAPRV